MVLRYSPGFYPFSNPSPGTHPSPSLVLAKISIFSDTRSNPTSPVLDRIPPFPVLAWTLLWYSPRFLFFLILARIPPLRYSLGSHLSRYSPEPFFGTHPDLPSLILTQIPPFSVLSWILPFPILARIPHFRYSPGSYLFL